MVIVYWIAVSALHSSTVPSEEQDPKDLVPMAFFNHTNWQIGDRALLPQGFKVPVEEAGGMSDAASEAGILDVRNGESSLLEGPSGSTGDNAAGPTPSADAAVDEVAGEAADGVTASKQRKISKLRKGTRKERKPSRKEKTLRRLPWL